MAGIRRGPRKVGRGGEGGHNGKQYVAFVEGRGTELYYPSKREAESLPLLLQWEPFIFSLPESGSREHGGSSLLAPSGCGLSIPLRLVPLWRTGSFFLGTGSAAGQG